MLVIYLQIPYNKNRIIPHEEAIYPHPQIEIIHNPSGSHELALLVTRSL